VDRPTFSQSWSRVSRLTPTLRPHVQISRQTFQGEPWFVVNEPVSNSFFRLNPVAHHFVCLLDAKRTVDEAWRLTLDRYGDLAPTQNEVIGLLGQLNESNLLRVDLPSDAEPLLQRKRKRAIKFWGGQAMSILFIRIPIFNPERLLKWLGPLFRPLLSSVGLVMWLAWMIYVAWQFIPQLSTFATDAQSVLAPKNIGWMLVLTIITKSIHELGHGLVCKRFGGVVPEIGIMMLVVVPVPFVDATSSWSFPSKWRRFLVGSAGMIFELAIAGIAALVWIHAEPETLVRQLSYNIVFMATVITILFNANPLLKFDGYYMLSDLLEIPNLYDRAKRFLQWLVQRYVYGMQNAQPVSTRSGEQSLLILYGVTSQIYKVLVLFGIVLFIIGQFYVIGMVLAAWSVIAWAVIPSGQFIHWLATHPSLHEHRVRAVVTTTLFLTALFAGLGALPMPDHYRSVGVIESTNRVELAIQTDGFIQKVFVTAGEKVEVNQIILIADSPDLKARQDQLKAQLRSLRSVQRQSLVEDLVAMKSTIAKIVAISEELEDINHRIKDLVLRTPTGGILVSNTFAHLEGQFLRRGQVVGDIIQLGGLRVTAMIDQAQNARLFNEDNRIETVELRTPGRLDQTLHSRLIQAFPAGQMRLPHPALGYEGGGDIALDPKDPNRQTTMRPQFELWLSIPEKRPGENERMLVYPGQRVYVRFTLENRVPLAFQWAHRLRQIFRERLAI